MSGASGYRIYLRSGNRVTYLGSVSNSATSVKVVGLTPGSTSELMIEAYSTTGRANSNWVSVTTPVRVRTVG